MSSKQKRLKKYLREILQTEPLSLYGEVAREALDYGSNVESFFSDLQAHGCQSGMIGKLIYYCDTHRFYDTYYDEIETLHIELEESLGEPLHPNGDLKNWYAWMAFEKTARMIYDELHIE